ncbi:Hypothetical protein KVN_LOCUS209 [uncultured virus]|nr:Hypothetical protein KVN_LOCUS209 [uncultured virus]
MSDYKCITCNKLFLQKIDFERHKKRKRPCENKNELNNDLKCNFCDKLLSSKYNLDRHLSHYCKDKNNIKITEEVLESSNKKKNSSGFIKPKDKFINSDNDLNDTKKNRTKSYLTRTRSYSTRTDACKSNKKKCEFCDKSISKTNYSKHIRICKEKKENKEKEELYNKSIKEKELIFKQLIEKMELLEKQNDKILKENKKLRNNITLNTTTKKTKNNSINNSTNISNNTNNTTNNTIDNLTNNTINIQLVAYGKEDYDKLTEKEYKYILNKGFKSVPEFVNQLHFDKNRPEYHNIYISNLRDNYVMVYDDNIWKLRNRKETMEELYEDKKNILIDKLEELINILPQSAINKFERFLNDEQDNKIKNGIIEEIKLLLHNNRNIPLATKMKLGLIKL